MKIRIFQPIVPEYRVALFEGVGKRYGDNVEIWAAEGSGLNNSYPLKNVRFDYNHPFKYWGSLCWQVGLTLNGLSRGDVVVICGDVHQLSSLWIAIKAKCRGIKVVWWGHHRTATSKEIGIKLRLAIAKILNEVYLCYTRTGIAYLEAHGFKHGRVFATGNTIDQAPIKEAINLVVGNSCSCREDDQNSNHLSTTTTKNYDYVLTVGVMREKIHLDLFLRAMTDKRLANLNLVVIGDGEMKESWQKLAADLGISDRVKWLPGTRDQKVMAPWFLGAKAFIYPGSIGLSILHAFSYGLPVITHNNAEHQMPEFEVMEDGKTGVCFNEGDVEDMIAKTAAFLSDESRRAECGRYCQDLAFNKYSMDQMIANFCEAINSAGGLK